MLAPESVSSPAGASLAGSLRLALDPVALARRAGLEPDAWQADVMRQAAPRVLLNCARQTGKSTTVAVLAVHRALFSPDALVLMLSPTLRQSGELFRTALGIYRAAGALVPTDAETALHVHLTNGSRIVSLPGREATVRGYSAVDLIVVDEAARVPDDLIAAVRPMLAVSGGRLIALSTPFGTRGWWYEAWRGPEEWQRVTVRADQCPRIPPAFLEQERRAVGSWWYEQEYECAFLDAQSTAFARADIDAAFAEPVDVWQL